MQRSDVRSPFARRSFLSRLGGGLVAAGTALGASASTTMAQGTSGGAWQPTRHAEDDWFDKIPGKHRTFLDTVSARGVGEALHFASNIITTSKSGYGLESNEVAMPDVAQYRATLGWQSGPWCIPVGFTEQRTLGGGDIRRQDMPFVSNRMNYTTAHAELMYFLPGVSGLRLDLGAAHTLRGRNVGQSTMIMTGFTYALHL